MTGREPDTAETVWDWLRALLFREFEDYESLVASNPAWAFENAIQAANTARALRRMASGVPREQAHELGMIRRDDDPTARGGRNGDD